MKDHKQARFLFEGMECFIVFPKERNGGKFALKTEYWEAFPEAVEIPLLEAGYHICFIQNRTRWGTQDDLDRKARFIRFLQETCGLAEKCVPVGMSCGGLIAIKFAAAYPELVSCLYLDAPVVNYMSCPCGFGRGEVLGGDSSYSEILEALSLRSLGELMAYRDMPLDRLPALVEHRIPLALVAGDSDSVVPFEENGIFVQRAYERSETDLIVRIKPGCDHHPHGLKDPSAIVEFILEHS